MTDRPPGTRYASVAIPVPLRRLFTYEVPESMAGELAAGSRVRVRFGHRSLNATVAVFPAEAPGPEVKTRPIESRIAAGPVLPPDLLDLTRFIADYYLCSWGEAIDAALPPETPPGRKKIFVNRVAGASVEDIPERAAAQRRAFLGLPEDGAEAELSGIAESDRRALRLLEKAGRVRFSERRDEPTGGPRAAFEEGESAPPPTPSQREVLDKLEASFAKGGFAPHLLYGQTGSGKTEVYLQSAANSLDRGRGVIYLVPEIGLTPLLRTQIDRRFPGRTEVLHSGLGARQRREAWERIRSGARDLVVGTRSAIFAPLPTLGLIVVDEEQDGSYKQDESPRYNARDVAAVRAREQGAVLLLGSATPSLESYTNATLGRYSLLRLGGRILDRPLAEVSLVDMRREYKRTTQVSPLSRRLLDELSGCLERGEQALILRNRRGWAAALLCPRCGERVNCMHCSISMTWHRADARLRCHYCDSEQRMPDVCPTCGTEDLSQLGEGTEKLESLLAEELPDARVVRMDRDTLRRRGSHEEMLRRFQDREIDILVGTQMIAKGHDFPRVTLVGVLSADQSLGLPDFRAGERTFQLLTQVAGRAGRGRLPGRVIVQGFDVEHPVLQLAAAQDYEAFYLREIAYRRALQYPPLAALAKIVIQNQEEFQARDWGVCIAETLREVAEGELLISGPGPAPVERLKGRYRQQILVRSTGRRRLVRSLDRTLDALGDRVPRKAFVVDVDPQALL